MADGMRAVFAGIALELVFFGAASWAQDPHPATVPQIRMQGILGSIIEPSRRMRAPGFMWDHEIQIALPKGYFAPQNAQTSYPVFWVTDGSWAFEMAVGVVNGSARTHVPEMITVGVGVPREEEGRYLEARRIYEFFTKRPESRLQGRLEELDRRSWSEYEKLFASRGTPLQYGGAYEFLAFLVDYVRPALAREYRMLANQNTLFGYSAGGAFCEYALLTRPQAFDKYICGGGWTNEILDVEEQYAKANKDLVAIAFFGFADTDIVANGFPLARALESRNYPSFRLRVSVFVDEDHSSAVPLTMNHGLRFVWEGPFPSRTSR